MSSNFTLLCVKGPETDKKRRGKGGATWCWLGVGKRGLQVQWMVLGTRQSEECDWSGHIPSKEKSLCKAQRKVWSSLSSMPGDRLGYKGQDQLETGAKRLWVQSI
jgi:hypothetical protein